MPWINYPNPRAKPAPPRPVLSYRAKADFSVEELAALEAKMRTVLVKDVRNDPRTVPSRAEDDADG